MMKRYETVEDGIKWASKHGITVREKEVTTVKPLSLRQAGTVDFLKANGYTIK